MAPSTKFRLSAPGGSTSAIPRPEAPGVQKPEEVIQLVKATSFTFPKRLLRFRDPAGRTRRAWKPRVAPVLLAATLAVASGEGLAAIYYVDQNHANASDANAGTSESAPWQTFQRAMSVVAGDTVYVKDGTYVGADDPCGNGTELRPGFSPQNSGTAAAPIAFRVYSGHTATLVRNVCNPSHNNPALGNTGSDYIIFDGFRLRNGNDVRIQSCNGCIVEYMDIDKGTPPPDAPGNYDGIRVEISDNITLRNNTIRNVYYSDNASDTNGACIKLYDIRFSRLHNNELYNCGAGINDKEAGNGNTYDLNYIHDTFGPGISFSGFTTARCDAWNCAVQNNTIHHNILSDTRVGVHFNLGSTSRDGNMSVYNNTMYSVNIGVEMNGPLPGMRIYNNIIDRQMSTLDNGNSTQAHHDTAPPADLLSNYNDCWAPSTPRAGFNVAWAPESWTQWRNRGHDANTLRDDPLYVGPLTGTPPPENFQLQPNSTLQSAGRVGGVSTGAAVDIGAYETGSEAIGTGAPPPPPPTDPPDAPTGLDVD